MLLYIAMIHELHSWNCSLLCVFTDIDECMEETHNCHPDAHCTNTIGGFECECFDGFIGDGVMWCKGRLLHTSIAIYNYSNAVYLTKLG